MLLKYLFGNKRSRKPKRKQRRTFGFESCEPRQMFASSQPRISIAQDVAVFEGDSGTTKVNMTVSLAERGTRVSSINYSTANGTAKSGEDYNAISGLLVFYPGQLSKTISVSIRGDVTQEPNEVFYVQLSNPHNLRLGDVSDTITIKNDDGGTTTGDMIVSINSVSTTEGGNPGNISSSWALHTSGSHILDSQNREAHITSIAIYGAETTSGLPSNYQQKIDQAKAEGFNAIRLPFSSQFIQSEANLQKMDAFIAYCEKVGMRVILDHHRSDTTSGGDASENGLWYNSTYTEQAWINDWAKMATRWKNSPAVIGADVHNEPHGSATWSQWSTAAQKAGNAILANAPNWLIVVEGVGQSTGSFWGEDLTGAKNSVPVLSVANRLVLSPHVYGLTIGDIPPFHASNFPNNMPAWYSNLWGWAEEQNRYPIWIGEISSGGSQDTSVITTAINYAHQIGADISWWPLDNNTQIAASWVKLLNPQPFPPLTGSTGTTPAGVLSFAITVSAASSSPITVIYSTANGTAAAGTDYTAKSGTLTFLPGETSKVLTVAAIGDTTKEANETFTVGLSGVVGAKLGTTIGTGTILNDD